MGNLKMLVARKIKGFVEYWSQQEEHKHIDPSVGILRGTVIGPNVMIGRYTYVGANTSIPSGEIGAFCSISSNVVIGGDEHSLNAVSTHPFWSAPNGWTFSTSDPTERWTQSKPAPVIGNDVWIGANAVVLRGAVIGDGAVIGAGAVVSGKIPPYAIAVGVPARVVNYRFSSEVSERIRSTAWWTWEEPRLNMMRSQFGDVYGFLRTLEPQGYRSKVQGS